MYRQYKYLPEFNRVCIKASRDRAYQQHMDSLKRMRTCVDTTEPPIPQTVGRNYKRYENESQRNETITRDNRRLLGKMNDIQRQEHYPRAVPQRPYTLMGQAQKDEMWRITHENHKLLTAVQERRPVLNRNDWLHHRLDHQYQITKMSEYKTTVPMGEIIRQETVRTSQSSRRSSKMDHDDQQFTEEETVYESPPEESTADGAIPDVIGDAAAGGKNRGSNSGTINDVIKDGAQGNVAKDETGSDPGKIDDPISAAIPPKQDDSAPVNDVIGDQLEGGSSSPPPGKLPAKETAAKT
jgi:hypothetical protein